MRVKEWEGDVVFLHEVAPGAADRSYGIQVARLAGLPAPVIARAQDVLTALEEGELSSGGGARAAALVDELPLFSAAKTPEPTAMPKESEAERALKDIDPDELTPKQALEALYRLKALGDGS